MDCAQVLGAEEEIRGMLLWECLDKRRLSFIAVRLRKIALRYRLKA